MKNLILALAATLVLNSATAQTNPPTFVKGTLDIRFATRTQREGNYPKPGITDKYTLSVNVCDSALFRGTVDARPYIPGTFSDQSGLVTYAIETDVVNPRNPAQTKNVGKLFGSVPVDKNNVYHFENGALRVSIFPMGSAKGFDSKFNGLALGKPPVVKEGVFSKLKKEALKITKQVNGKTVALNVTNYDKMEFQNHQLAAGPVQVYPEVLVNGVMIYDYSRSAWYLQNVTVAYIVDNRQVQDRLSGNIRWVESPTRKTSGEGEYQFDVRVNEPPVNEASHFEAAKDESAFFDTDNTIPALVGSMKYKDTMFGEVVSASTVQIHLTGNNLSKQQAMYLAKLFLLSCIVPLNDE
jgi:hypothetical protein